MTWISQIFFCVLITSATGSAMLAIWFLCRIFLTKWNPNLVYYMLRWVVLMFLLPFTYTAIGLNYENGYIQQKNSLIQMLFIMNLDELLFQGFAVIWFLMTLFIGGVFVVETIRKYRLCRDNFEDGDSLAQTEFERIKEVLGIRGKVTLYRNCNPNHVSPFALGLFHRKVVIPYLEYTKEELDIILYHELSHIKKCDILFRYLAIAAMILNSINPFSYVLLKLVLHWSEADCDVCAVEGLEKEGITQKTYAKTIFRLMNETTKKREIFTITMLHGAAKSLYRRIEFMEIYRENGKKVTKSVTMALVMLFVLFSSVTAYAAGLEIAEANDERLKETQVLKEESTFEVQEIFSEVIYIPAEEAKVPNTVYVNDGIMTIGNGTINWEVPVETRYVTTPIYLKEGTEVQIATTAKPSDATYWIGVMYPSSAIAIAEGTGVGGARFTIPSSGYYRILVENRSDVVISVTGGYSY